MLNQVTYDQAITNTRRALIETGCDNARIQNIAKTICNIFLIDDLLKVVKDLSSVSYEPKTQVNEKTKNLIQIHKRTLQILYTDAEILNALKALDLISGESLCRAKEFVELMHEGE